MQMTCTERISLLNPSFSIKLLIDNNLRWRIKGYEELIACKIHYLSFLGRGIS